MKKLISIISIVAILAAMMTPITFAETVTKTDIIYEDNFDEGIYTTEFNEAMTEMYLLKDGVKTWTFVKNDGASFDESFGADVLNNISTNGKLMTTGALSGSVEVYYNFAQPITTGAVTVEIDLVGTSAKMYFAIAAHAIETVSGGIGDSTGNKSGYNNNEGELVSMMKQDGVNSELLLLNIYGGETSKSNQKMQKAGSGTAYTMNFVVDVVDQTQAVTMTKGSTTKNYNKSWYANGVNPYHMADKQVAALFFPELNEAALNVDNIKVTHTYEAEEEVTEPKAEVENLAIAANDGKVSSSATFNWNDGDAEIKSARLVTAIYDNEGKLITVKSATATVSASNTSAALATEAITVPDGAKTVKAFVWDFATLKPYATTEIPLN